MNVLYYDNCWFTNIGESFIDIGAMEIVKEIFQNCKIANISNMSSYYVTEPKRKFGMPTLNMDKWRFCLADILKLYHFDCIILAGMFVSKQHLTGKVSMMLRAAALENKKIIFLGLGEEPDISEETIEAFKKYLSDIKPALIMTRDQKTYLHLKDCARCIPGIDAAFWVKNVYDPRGFAKQKYDIVAYNRTKEPKKFEKQWEFPIIRPYHFQLSYLGGAELRENTFISDIPYDYITLYANANNVYTDLVHATIISLQFGKKVEYTYTDSRANAFLDLKCISKQDRKISLDEDQLEEIKVNIIHKIKNELGRGVI